MVVEPFFVASCVDVAVMVTCVAIRLVLAMKTPEVGPIVSPPLALHVTPDLKLPDPETVAVHWLVCPELTAVGLQLAPTATMIEAVFDSVVAEVLLP